MSNLIGSNIGLSEDERVVLRTVAGLIIPSSEEYGVPGADDEEIFGHILDLLVREHPTLQAQLIDFEALARRRNGASFMGLSPADRIGLLKDSASSGFLRTMIHCTATCFYQDGRVLETIGLKSTPPFPGGHEVEQGDWSLLDPVKHREPFYRKV